MKTFNKTLHPIDYGEPGMGLWVYAYDLAVKMNVPHMPGAHIHRRWEYGLAMEFLKELDAVEKTKTILDVGGAGSLLAPIAMSMGYEVTVIDPDPCVHIIAGQIRTSGGIGCAINMDFFEADLPLYDVVVSISTVEHVSEDANFIRRLAEHARRGVFLTTDFSMDGLAHSEAHLRTYSPKTMANKLAAAFPEGWKFAGEPDWVDCGRLVYDYNFASLGMVAQ